MHKSGSLILGSLLVLAASSACAQSLSLTPATGVLEPQALTRPVATETATKGRVSGGLIPFEQGVEELRFTGEDDTRILSFHLSEAEAKNGGALRLAYQNAVSVLPDDGIVDVELNGQQAGSFAIRSPSGYRPETLVVSPDILKPGRNTVRIRARQHHRVDCSADAVYELWTRLDQQQSGFLSAGRTGFVAIDDLRAIGRNGAGTTEIRLIAPDSDRLAISRDAMRTIEALTLFLNRQDIRVTVADKPGEGAGIDLYFGDTGTYAQTPRAAQILSGAPAGLSVRNGETSGRATVIMRGGNAAALQAALVTAVNGPMRPGLAEGVLSPAVDTIIADRGDSFTLKDVGYRTAPFHGRLSRTQFRIEMPANFYPGDYDTVDVVLKAATAPGLAAGAQFLVRVNDRAVTSYRFHDPEGSKFDGKRIELPLRAFHPGVNRVELLAELPMESDAACVANRDESKPRFILLDDTAIEIPQLARIGRMPDLAAFAGGAYPFNRGEAFDVIMDQPDSASLGAAMTMVSRLSLSARKPLDAVLTVGSGETASDRDALILKVAARAAAAPTGGDVMGGKVDQLFTSAIVPGPAPSMNLASAAPAGSDALLEAFQASTALDNDRLSWSTRLMNLIARPLPAIGQWLKYGTAGEGPKVDQTNILMQVSQQRAPLGDATWTVLNADNPADLEAGVNRLTSATQWASLTGGSAIVRRTDGGISTGSGADYALVEITDTSVSNLRRLAAAWLSDHFGIYVALVVGCLGFFGLWLGYAVPRKGVRTTSDD